LGGGIVQTGTGGKGIGTGKKEKMKGEKKRSRGWGGKRGVLWGGSIQKKRAETEGLVRDGSCRGTGSGGYAMLKIRDHKGT